MQKLFILFIIYAFLLSISLVVGYAVGLALPQYSNLVTASLLIISSLVAISLFIFDTGDGR